MRISMSKLNSMLSERNYNTEDLIKYIGLTKDTFSASINDENENTSLLNKICEFLDCEPRQLLDYNPILNSLRQEKEEGINSKIYELTQVKLTYSSLDISNYGLTEKQIAHIFETNNIATLPITTAIETLIEINNHFKCIDYVIDNAESELSEFFIKQLHYILNQGTEYSRSSLIGEFIFQTSDVNDNTIDIPYKMNELLTNYNSIKNKNLGAIIKFLYYFIQISPFERSNDTIARLLAFKECLKYNIIPFYIDNTHKNEYKKGLSDWKNSSSFLIHACKIGQANYSQLLSHFNIK